MYQKGKYMPGKLVWVPREALALYSKPGRKDTQKLWNVGIIIYKDKDGNTEVYVNGQFESTHTNFLKLVE